MKIQRSLTARTNLRMKCGAIATGVLLLAGCGSGTEDASSGTEETSSGTEETSSGTEETSSGTEETSSGTEETSSGTEETSSGTEDASSDTEETSSGVDVGLFLDGALAEEPTTEACTLNGGAETTCYRIVVAGYPANREAGPFCPRTVTDDAEAGGIWFDGEGVYELDGEFIAGLADHYDDDHWHLYDEDGNVLYTETAEEFEAAARPDVDPELQNHCVEGQLDWLENGEPITSTVLIPTAPVAADSSSTSRGNLGVTLDGVVIAESAPVDAILSAYTIAAFDDCGGHFNPFEGYHMHGAVGCSEVGEAVDGDTPMFGYAMDGYAVHSPLTDAEALAELDECNGHTTEAAGYHYHANNAAENQVIECLVGQSVESGGPGR